MLQMLTSCLSVAVANLVESGEMSTASTQFPPSTSMRFSCNSPSQTLAPVVVPHAIHWQSLDTEMACTSIPVCLPTSWPSERRHRRIPSSPPHKRCLPLGWNTTAYAASEPPVSSTIVWSYWIVSIAQSHLGAATHQCSSATSSLMAHSCQVGRVEEQGKTFGLLVGRKLTRFPISTMVRSHTPSCLWRLFLPGSQQCDLVVMTR